MGQVPKKQMGEVYLRLGDLQQCNGNWEQAVDDYTRSLKLYSTELEDDDRTLATVRTSSTQRGLLAAFVQ